MTTIHSPLRRGVLTLLVVLGLLLAFGGSATATRLITGKQVKDGTVTTRDLRNSSLTGTDVKNGSLAFEDLEGAVARLVPPDGDRGPAGPQGAQGARGVAGLRQLQSARTNEIHLGSGQFVDQFVACPPGLMALNGGMSTLGDASDTRVTESRPSDSRTSWRVRVQNDDIGAITVFLWATCATP